MILPVRGLSVIVPRRAFRRRNIDHARTDVRALATFTVAQRAVGTALAGEAGGDARATSEGGHPRAATAGEDPWRSIDAAPRHCALSYREGSA